jgi:hypothetical protein
MPENTTFEKVEYSLEALFESVKNLYSNDSSLIDNDVHEQAISYKIAHNFENILNLNSILSKNNLSVDVEYNRRIDRPKEYTTEYEDIKNKCRKDFQQKIKEKENNDIEEYILLYIDEYIEKKKLRPDIILHERKTNESNIIAIEIKKNPKYTDFDKKKLKFLTRQDKYNYKLGLSLVLTKAEPNFTFYVQEEYYQCFIAKVNALKDYIKSAEIKTFVVVNNEDTIEYLDKEEYEKYSQKMLNYNTKTE